MFNDKLSFKNTSMDTGWGGKWNEVTFTRPTNNVWHHMTWVIQGSSNVYNWSATNIVANWKLYIDGFEVNTTLARGLLHHNEIALNFSGYGTHSLKIGGGASTSTQKTYMEDIRIFRNNFSAEELDVIINRHRFRLYHHDLGEPEPQPEPEPEPQLRVINHYDFINTSSLTSLGYGGTTLQSNGTATNGTYGFTRKFNKWCC
jgi:hypothetical protein